MAYAVGLIDGDGRASVFLHLLDDLSARANHGSDELLGDVEGLNAGNLRLQLSARLRDGLHHLVHDVLAASLGLHQRTLNDLKRQAVALDIHLCGGEAVLRARGLEVHVAEVVLVTKDIREDGKLVLTGVVDETHGDAGHRILDGHTGVHQGECAATDAGHRR